MKDHKERNELSLDTEIDCGCLARHHREIQGTCREEELEQPVSAGSAGAAVGGDRRGLQLLDGAARRDLQTSCTTLPGFLGNGGQRSGNGLRQHG